MQMPKSRLLTEGCPANVAALAAMVFPKWVGREVDQALLEDAFAIDIPLVNLGERSSAYAGISVVELFHGPTGSFKDFGARFLARWMSSQLPPPLHGRVVLVATSGDTGSAVAEGFAGRPNTSVVVLYPHKGISSYQRLQLTKPRPGVRAFAVKGSFDDCQRSVKDAFRDPALSHLELTSANSINLGRLVPQMLFYLWSAAKADVRDPLFVVPSGNLGNLCAGLMAGRFAIPDARFVGATNRNKFFVEYLKDRQAPARRVVRTVSNAMDVGVPSNLERIAHLFPRPELLKVVEGRAVSDPQTRATMKKVYEETGYVADPHTAVGLTAALASRRKIDRRILVMSTAKPEKFRELVDEATGRTSSAPSDGGVEDTVIDPGLPTLRQVILQTIESTRQ